MAIPKVIHYCWFGGAPLPEKVVKCIESWKKWCPDYQIIRWDESNYDYTKNKFAYDAYLNRKWAFVSDVARLDIIYHYGGIYLDTDVELIKTLDFLLNDTSFMAFEHGKMVNTGLGFGAEKGNYLIYKNLEAYENLVFSNVDDALNLIYCSVVTTNVLQEFGLVREDRVQMLAGLKVYPTSYFCPMILNNGTARIKKETVAIHHCTGSWLNEKEKHITKVRRNIYTRFGRMGLKIYDGRKLLQEQGLLAFLRRCFAIAFKKYTR